MAGILQFLFIGVIVAAIAGLLYFAIRIMRVVPIFTLGDAIDERSLSDQETATVELPQEYLERVREFRAQPLWPQLWPALLGILLLLIFLACVFRFAVS